jgi:hypothetical protein
MNAADSSSSPSRQQLQDSLHDLHEELARSPRVDPEARRRLQTLLAEVHRLLHGPHQGRAAAGTVPGEGAGEDAGKAAGEDDASELPSATSSERLETLAVEFEAQHPVLAGSLRQFIELCSRAGL